jgi:hypothetical protein
MTPRLNRLLAAALIAGLAACATDSTTPGFNNVALAGAFNTTPLGFDAAVSSFDGSMGGHGWAPRGDHFGGGFMGGGLGADFLGGGLDFGMGHGRHGDDHFPGDANCAFNSGTGRVECATQSFGGLTIVRSAQYKDAGGNVQQAFDSTTSSINTRVTVSGTVVRRDNDTSTVANASDRTVVGLKGASRTVNGTSGGSEKTVGRDTTGHFTALRTIGDTTKAVVIPAPTAGSPPPYPTSGTVIRGMSATLTYDGKSPTSTTRREVITYNGTNTATVVITQDGTTRNCTLPLPRGRLTCQ